MVAFTYQDQSRRKKKSPNWDSNLHFRNLVWDILVFRLFTTPSVQLKQLFNVACVLQKNASHEAWWMGAPVKGMVFKQYGLSTLYIVFAS